MRIKLQPLLIILLYIAVFASAISQLRYQLLLSPFWHGVFSLSQYSIIGLSLLIITINLEKSNWKINDKLILWFILYFIYIYVVSYSNSSLYVKEMFQHALPWPLTFIACLLYAKHNDIPQVVSGITFYGMLILFILSFPNIARHLTDYGRRGGVIFPVYYCFGFLSCALMFNKRIVKYIFIAIVALLLMISTKRAGFVAVLVGVLFFFYVDAFVQGSLKRRIKKMTLYTIFVILAVIIGFYLIDKYNINIIQRLNNIFDDSGSNRFFIWEDVLGHFKSSSLMKKVFGHGFHSVYYDVKPYGYRRLAHNSYIEYLYDFGIVGLVFISCFSIYILHFSIRIIKRKTFYAPAVAYSIPGMIMLTFVSYFYEQSVIIMPYVLLWGLCLGLESKEKNSTKNLIIVNDK